MDMGIKYDGLAGTSHSDIHMNASYPAARAVRCAIYARYSSKLQTEKSIEDQVGLCEAHARREGWEVAQIYADRALSGTSMAPRKSLLRLVADAKDGKFNVVLTEGLDRLTRNQVDTAYFYHAMTFVDVKIYSIADGSFVNEMHVGFKGIQHAMFIKDLGQKTRRGQEGTVKKGLISGSLAYGYRIVRSVKTPSGGREIDEAQADIVRRIYNEWNSGVSVLAIAKRLNVEGIPGADGGLWRPSTIFGSARAGTGILRNELYRGVNKWGKNQIRRTPEGTIVRRLAPESALVVVDVPHLRIIDDTVFLAAQQRLNSGRGLLLHKRKRPKHLLAGLLQCDVCKNGYILLDGTRYGCSGRSALGVCENSRRVGRAELEKAVLDLIVFNLLEPELLREYVREYDVESRKQAEESVQRVGLLGKRVTQVKSDLSRLIAALKHPDMSGASVPIISQEINVLASEQEKLDAELAEAQSSSPKPLDADEIIKNLREHLPQLRVDLELDGPKAAHARQTFRALIDRVIIKPHGEGDLRGGGSVSFRMEGSITALLGAGLSERVCVVPSCTSPRAGRYHAIWSLSGTIDAVPYHHSADKRLKRLLKTQYDQFLIGQLRQAKSPLTASAMARAYMTSQGVVASESLMSNWCHRFRMRLYVLKELGIADTVTLPGKQFQGWVAADRKEELRFALPPLESRHRDNELVFAELNRANRPLMIEDFVRAVFRESGETASPRRLVTVDTRVRNCLRRHRQDGKFATIYVPGRKAFGWVLATRLPEFFRPPNRPVNVGKFDGEIRAIMTSSEALLTCPEIARYLHDRITPKVSRRTWTLRAARNWVSAFLREQRRFGKARPVVSEGKKAQRWELLDGKPSATGEQQTSIQQGNSHRRSKRPIAKSAASKPPPGRGRRRS